MSRYIEAPEELDPTWRALDPAPAVFLAGGITDCPDWQQEARQLLESHNVPVVLLNPRRADFPIHDPSAAHGQIAWEHRHLAAADVILFWFPASPSPQPIALYELGFHAAANRKIAVGTDPAYSRAADVVIQLSLARPDVAVRPTLKDTLAELIDLLQ